MDDAVGTLGLDGLTERGGVGHVRTRGASAGGLRPGPPDHRHDFVVAARELRANLAPEEAARARDQNLHPIASITGGPLDSPHGGTAVPRAGRAGVAAPASAR